VSRRSELQQLEADREIETPLSIEDRVIELHSQNLYHYEGIAKLTGLSFRQVRKIIRDHLKRTDNPNIR
jgi:hypothetical protein